MFSVLEMDHLLKNLFKVFEALFLDWSIVALAKKIDSDLPEDIAADWRSVLSCADKAVRDSSMEMSSLYAIGILKRGISGSPLYLRA